MKDGNENFLTTPSILPVIGWLATLAIGLTCLGIVIWHSPAAAVAAIILTLWLVVCAFGLLCAAINEVDVDMYRVKR